MTDEERDALLLRLDATVGGLESKVDRLDDRLTRLESKVDRIDTFVRGMAVKLLSLSEIQELEKSAMEAATVR